MFLIDYLYLKFYQLVKHYHDVLKSQVQIKMGLFDHEYIPNLQISTFEVLKFRFVITGNLKTFFNV